MRFRTTTWTAFLILCIVARATAAAGAAGGFDIANLAITTQSTSSNDTIPRDSTIDLAEGSLLSIAFTLKYPDKSQLKCPTCHLFPPNQVSILLQGDHGHERVFVVKEEGGNRENHRFGVRLSLDNDRHYHPASLLPSGHYAVTLLVASLNPDTRPFREKLLDVNLSMAERDAFPVYVYGFPLQDFHHKELPNFIMAPKQKSSGTPAAWSLAMAAVAAIPAVAWWFVVSPKFRRNPNPLPVPLARPDYILFILAILVALSSFTALWFFNASIMTVLKTLGCVSVLVAFGTRRVAIAMLRRRVRVQIRDASNAEEM